MKRTSSILVNDIIEDNQHGHIKKYARGKYLGKGGFAKCYEMTSMDSGRTYAGKVIPKSSLVKPNARRKLINEIKIHKAVYHRHIVHFVRYFEDSANVYIMLELCSNKTLMELVKQRTRLTETETQVYMWQLLGVVEYLHARNVIHRDLKLSNLFLYENMEIKVGDFGLAAQLEHANERKRTICGTPNYIAPEILNNNNGHSFEVDVWSMGVIMYTMLIGKPPFETNNIQSTYKKIRDNSYEFPEHVRISAAAKSLITRILHSQPEMRPSLAEVRNHAFFSQAAFPNSLPQSTWDMPYSPLMATQSAKPDWLSGTAPEKENVAFHGTGTVTSTGAGAGAGARIGSGTMTAAAGFSKPAFGHPSYPSCGSGLIASGLLAPGLGSVMPRAASAPSIALVENIRTSDGFAVPERRLRQPGAVSPAATRSAGLGAASLRTTQAQSLVIAVSGFPISGARGSGFGSATTQPATSGLSSGFDAQSRGTTGHKVDSDTEGERKERSTMVQRLQAMDLARDSTRQQLVSDSTRRVSAELAVMHGAAEELRRARKRLTMPDRDVNGDDGDVPMAAGDEDTTNKRPSPATKKRKDGSGVADAVPHGFPAPDASVRPLPMDVASPSKATARREREQERERVSLPREAEDDDRGHLRQLHDDIERSFAMPAHVPAQAQPQRQPLATVSNNVASTDLRGRPSAAVSPHKVTIAPPQMTGPDLWVNQWTDHSDRYGLGYLLSNGNLGVYFNDASKAILLLNRQEFEYIDRRNSSHYRYSLDRYPAELKKKVTLLRYFYKVLVVKEDRARELAGDDTTPATGEAVYVKKWLRTKYAIFFRLSNRTVQVVFYDQTEVLLKDRLVTYTNREKQRKTYELDKVFHDRKQRPDLAKRLKYIKELISHLITRSPPAASSHRPSESDSARQGQRLATF